MCKCTLIINMHGTISNTWQHTRCYSNSWESIVAKIRPNQRFLFSWVGCRPSWWPRDHPFEFFKTNMTFKWLCLVFLGEKLKESSSLICDCSFYSNTFQQELVEGARRDPEFQSRLRVMDIDEADLQQWLGGTWDDVEKNGNWVVKNGVPRTDCY